MSRLGKMPIAVPKGVEVKAKADGTISINGPKGQVELKLPIGLTLKIDAEEMLLECDAKKIEKKGFWGLFRSLLNNGVVGVTTGYEVKLSLIGVGYRANIQGTKLDLQLGFSHPTWLEIPKDLTIAVVKGTSISVKGSDKRVVGQFAAKVRAMKPPEPYKGKGIRYENEYVRKKEGKAAKGKT